MCIITLLVIRWHLARENRRRDMEPRDHTYDDNWVEIMRDDGTVERVKVPKVLTPARFILWHTYVVSRRCAVGVLGSHGHSKPRFSLCFVALSLVSRGGVPPSTQRTDPSSFFCVEFTVAEGGGLLSDITCSCRIRKPPDPCAHNAITESLPSLGTARHSHEHPSLGCVEVMSSLVPRIQTYHSY